MIEGKPIPETADTQYNEMYRAFTVIPDQKDLGEAIGALREATARMGADPKTPKELLQEVVKEDLRVELVLSPIPWKIAEPLLHKSLEITPNDPRAHYFLARFEYDQPNTDTAVPTEIKKKTTDRVDLAREHLASAKKHGSPFWRTAGLEAEILDWPVRTAAARKVKPESVVAAETALDTFLFAPGGAIEAAGKGEKIAKIVRADAQGITSVLLVGMERAVIDARRSGGTPDRVRTVLQASLDVADKMSADPSLQLVLPDVMLAVVEVASAAQSVLARADPSGWHESMARLNALIAKTADAVKSRPLIQKYVANLATVDAFQAARVKDMAAAKELNARATKALEEGLKIAEEMKLAPVEIDDFHRLLAERKLLAGGNVETIEPHLARLRASTFPKVRLDGQFLEAAVAERQGKMEKARKILQALTNDRNSPEVDLRDRAFRANVLLYRVARATGDEVAALATLNEVDAKYSSELISPGARAWADEYVGGADAITAGRISGNLAVALQAVTRFVKENPGKTVPGELVATLEATAEDLMKKLRPPSPWNRKARLDFANFYLKTNRKNLAESRLSDLTTDYPDSVDILRARCFLLAAPADAASSSLNPNGVAAADALIRSFLKSYPRDRAGRLLNAEWLVLTSRAAVAAEFLKDPANFPGGRDAVVERVLAVALFRSGQREEAQKILTRLPPDPAIDAVLIQAATTREAGEKQLKEALGRQYDDPGLFRVYEAALRLNEGKYEDAIREFASAVEFTRVGPAAKAGLQRAIVAYAEVEPAKARDVAVKMAAEMPDEPGLYLAAVDAALVLDEIGEPTDKWEQTKTAWAALNRWEATATKAGTPRADIGLTRTQFQLLAGNPDGAKREAANSLAREPKHVPTLLALADLSLFAPADPAYAREMYDTAVKENSADPRLPYLDGRIKAASGDWAGAAAVYERLIEETPRNPAPYALLVAAREGAGKKDDALAAAKQWSSKLPDDVRATGTVIRLLGPGSKAEAVKVADEFVSRTVAEARKRIADVAPPLPQADADKSVDRARGNALLVTAGGFFRGRLLDEAEARAKEASKYLPDDERIALLLGDMAILKKDWDTALRVYGSVLKKNPRHFIAGNNLAWILADQKSNPAAALLVVEAVRKGRNGVRAIGPERLPADFLDTIGVVYVKLNQSAKFAEMQSLFDVAIRRYPSDPRMYLYLGQAQAGTGEKSKALESLDVATRLAGAKNALSAEQNKTVIEAAEAARKQIRK